MAIKDLALFKMVGNIVKKGKDKITGIATPSVEGSSSENVEESVQATFKAMVGKSEDSISSESSVDEKIEAKTEDIKTTKTNTKVKPVAKKATKAVKPKVTKKATSKTVGVKTTTAKKSAPKKVVKKTTASKAIKTTASKSTKSVVKSSTTTTKAPAKKAIASSSTKREEKIKLYSEDIKKHLGSVDESFLAIVVKNLGPSIYRKDAESVACSDPKELETVRKNFLIKKLGFDKSENDMLDGEIKKVCETMKGVRTKYRATFHYILAKNLKKESALS